MRVTELCVCGHSVNDHTQADAACDRLVVEDQPHGGKQWHVCRCLAFNPAVGR